VYGAVLEGLDIGIGKILATLEEQGLRENTLVVFFSDNGAPRRVSPNTPLNSGKDTVFEGGIRTPAIIRWPHQAPAGVITQHPVAVNDLFPTIFSALKLNLPKDLKLDGSSQWQALTSPQPIARQPFLIASHDIACFDGDWKLIETTDGKRALYNLKTDLSETKDEAAAHPDIFKSLGAKLDELKQGLPAAPERRQGPGGGGPGGPGGPGKGRGFGKGPGGPSGQGGSGPDGGK
jgi:arylsulfatase A-like enzyme